MAAFKKWINQAMTALIDPDKEARLAAIEHAMHQGLTKHRDQFVLRDCVAGLESKPSDLETAGKNVYRKILSRGWGDGVLAPGERATAQWVARALELRPEDTMAVNEEFARQHFARALAEAMEDGVLDTDEQARLNSIAESAGSTLPRFARSFFQVEGERFLRAIFLSFVENNRFCQQEWERLLETAEILGFTREELLHSIRAQSRAFVEHVLADAKADGVIAEREQQVLHWLMDTLAVPEGFRNYVIREIWRVQTLHDIRKGKLPSEPAPAEIEVRAGELVHFSGRGIWRQARMLKSGLRTDDHHGRITLTDNRLIFSSPTKSHSVGYRRVVSHRGSDSHLEVHIENKPVYTYFLQKASPFFHPIYSAAVAMSNQTLTADAESARSRHIPRDVRQRVWQRYGGRCAECSATEYLEFDHIVPFAKGGSNSDNNVQLLCRRCNLKKSDHI